MKITQENITELKPNEIFVFGSNTRGLHLGGAALVAYKKFGAEFGVSEGLSGNTYAIPTMSPEGKRVTKKLLKLSFYKFLKAVQKNKDKEFLLTKIGCGIAGWEVRDVAEILSSEIMEFNLYYGGFGNHNFPDNLSIPEEFVKYLFNM